MKCRYYISARCFCKVRKDRGAQGLKKAFGLGSAAVEVEGAVGSTGAKGVIDSTAKGKL